MERFFGSYWLDLFRGLVSIVLSTNLRQLEAKKVCNFLNRNLLEINFSCSVVGLNLDFLALNLMGFFLYSLFNAGMFWIDEIRQEYTEERPGSINPVLINDIFFSFHAFFAVVLTIIQCFIYEVKYF